MTCAILSYILVENHALYLLPFARCSLSRARVPLDVYGQQGWNCLGTSHATTTEAPSPTPLPPRISRPHPSLPAPQLDQEKLGDRFREQGLSNFKALSFLKGSGRYREGIELLEKAGDAYRTAENYEKAAETYAALYRLYDKHVVQGSLEDFVQLGKLSNYAEAAGDNFDEVDTKRAIEFWNTAAYLKKSANNFTGAGKLYKTLAKLEYERDNLARCIECWQQAADSYEGGSSPLCTL